jgi:hypothetical protein
MWKCDCDKTKELRDDETCGCGMALEIEDNSGYNYELEEILEQIEILTKKAQQLLKNK